MREGKNVLFNRKGIFYIPTSWIESYPDLVKEIMGKCIVFKAEHRLDLDSVQYYAFSDSFDEIDPREVPKLYSLNLKFIEKIQTSEPGKMKVILIPVSWDFTDKMGYTEIVKENKE